MRINKHLSFLVMTAGIAAAAIAFGVFAGRGGSDVASAAAGDPGTATFSLVAPGGTQPLSTPFNVAVNLSQFAPSVGSPTWGGYDLEVAYDSTLQIISDTRGLCSSSGWANTSLTPHVVSGCAFQSSTATGALETLSVQCVGTGTAQMSFVLPSDPNKTGSGSTLSDETAVPFTMFFVNTQVGCNVQAATPTTAPPTSTPTVTNTPLATNTPLPPTPTPGAATQTVLAIATQTSLSGTQTAQADVNVTPATFTPTPLGSPQPTGTAGAGTPAAGNTPPGGVTGPGGGPGGAPGGTIRLPDTGDGASAGGGMSMTTLWAVVAALIGLGALGGATTYLQSRRTR